MPATITLEDVKWAACNVMDALTGKDHTAKRKWAVLVSPGSTIQGTSFHIYVRCAGMMMPNSESPRWVLMPIVDLEGVRTRREAYTRLVATERTIRALPANQSPGYALTFDIEGTEQGLQP